MKRVIAVSLLLASVCSGAADKPAAPAIKPFTSDWESLKQYQCPEWFRDAKLGIWSHWGPVAAPGGFGGNWYARQMYVQGSREYENHLKTYGHPSKFGYKDVIELWKAETFDPDRLMDLYVKAGAKYFVSMGAHHDNFDLWNSKHQEWNAVNHGPKKDIVGLWRDAARQRGLRFGVSEHFARSYSWMQRSHGSDATGPMAGVPYDGADPKYVRLYGPPHGDAGGGYPVNPPATWTQEWFDRMQDLVVSYQPDLVYSDGGIPFGEVGRRFVADFYNLNMKAHGGKLEAVYNIKIDKGTGDYVEGVGVQDAENSVLAGIKDKPWQTDASIGTWFFVPDLEPKWRRSGPDVIVMLADIVAKNGNLLLNIPQRGDGTIDAEAEQVLADLAAWTKVNGEAIFATRPWMIAGEGPALTTATRGIKRAADYTAADIRFTRSKDGTTLYAIALGMPADGKLVVRSLAKAAGRIGDVKLLGHAGKLDWQQLDAGLEVTLPAQMPCGTACALKITGTDLKPAPVVSPSQREAGSGRAQTLPAVAKPLPELQRDLVNLRFGMFICASPVTYLDLPDHFQPDHAPPRQGKDEIAGTADDLRPTLYNPAKLDCGQWADAAKSAGMKTAVLLTKHHDGFCLWPSRYSTYTVAQGCKRDVVREFVDAFRQRGLTVGLYYSIRDRTERIATDAAHGGVSAEKIQLIKNQLTELLTNYGEISYIMFDAWGNNWHESPSFWDIPYAEIHSHIKSIQPNCLVLNHSRIRSVSDVPQIELRAGMALPSGADWAAAGGDTLQSAWFWQTSYPTMELRSVDWVVNQNLRPFNQRNVLFFLNCAPNRDGLMDANVLARLTEIGKAWTPPPPLQTIPDSWQNWPVPSSVHLFKGRNLAQGKPVRFATTQTVKSGSDVVDGNPNTSVDLAGKAAWLEIDLGETQTLAGLHIWNRFPAKNVILEQGVVFVSDQPFQSDDPAAIRQQAGVKTISITEPPGYPTPYPINAPARYVRVVSTTGTPIGVGEVEVFARTK